jgi:REP element-mobilizing transposase RayT
MTYYERNLPHWQPKRVEIFLTWRLYGSLPANVLAYLRLEESAPGRKFARAERALEKNATGPLWLREPRIAACVEAAILRGDRELKQYALIAYVVMPNHVHLLTRPIASLAKISNGLKGVTSREANRILDRTGRPFWQDESFDRWVRDDAERGKIISYIENNPVKAKLVMRAEDWPWSSAGRRLAGPLLIA